MPEPKVPKPSSIRWYIDGEHLPVAYPTTFGICSCSCHHTPGVKHFAPCCYPPEIIEQPTLMEDET